MGEWMLQPVLISVFSGLFSGPERVNHPDPNFKRDAVENSQVGMGK